MGTSCSSYDRRLKGVRRRGRQVTGTLAVTTPPKFVTVYRIDVCTKQRTATRAKVSKTGTFTFTMRPRDAATPYALYRVQAKIGRTSRSYSTQVAVTR